MATHRNLIKDDLHEAKQISYALTTDAGKVITPSDTVAGAGVLRKLVATEVGAVSSTGDSTVAGSLNMTSLKIGNKQVVGAQLAAIPDYAISPATDAVTAGSADLAAVNASLVQVQTALNALLAVFRSHGLVAT